MGVLAGLAIMFAAVVRSIERRKQLRKLKASGLPEKCREIFAEIEDVLCVCDAVDHRWRENAWRLQWQRELSSSRSASQLARKLRAFEEHILAERLVPAFLRD